MSRLFSVAEMEGLKQDLRQTKNIVGGMKRGKTSSLL